MGIARHTLVLLTNTFFCIQDCINAQNDLSLDSSGYIDNLNAGLISAGGSLDLSAIAKPYSVAAGVGGHPGM